ncbi:MAG: hypothetical protein NT062_17560, partial [Proteobacteria bacterium]|nr:hypothetical protein [Pseudomonadota bacterium]
TLVGKEAIDATIELLVRARQQRPSSFVVGLSLAEVLATAGRWADRARVLTELAAAPGAHARDVARAHSAVAWDRAARVAATIGDVTELETATRAALDAWALVLEDDPLDPVAHGAALVLAGRLADWSPLAMVLERARVAEGSPWAASSLALRQARLRLRTEPELALAIMASASGSGPGPTLTFDDPRRTLAAMIAAAQARVLGEAVTALEARATQLETRTPATREPAMLQIRAAQLALDLDDVPRARRLLERADVAVPGVVDDLLDAAKRRAGQRPAARLLPRPDSFVRVLRDAEQAMAADDGPRALELYQRALDLRPGSPLAAAPLVRIATTLRLPAPIATLALVQIGAAERAGDAAGKATPYELLARVERMRGDAAAAQRALERAVQADPTRLDLLQQLEQELVVTPRTGELLRLREREIVLVRSQAVEQVRDLAPLLIDTAILATREDRPEAELAALYRAALAVDPDNRLALFHLETLARRAGETDELIALEERIAGLFADPHDKATFLTRAGETLAKLGMPALAVQRFATAVELYPGHLPAIDGWLQTAMDA